MPDAETKDIKEAVLELGSGLVLRTAWVYDLQGRNFLNTMKRLASERDVLRVMHDQVGSPTPAWLIAEVTVRLLLAGAAGGIRHVTTRGHTSWCGFARAIMEELHGRGLLEHVPRIEPISTAEYLTRATRPAWTGTRPRCWPVSR